MPTIVTTQPGVVTTQPLAASVPAGLSPGVYTIPYGNATSFVVSVGGGSTVIVSSTTSTSGSGSGSTSSGSAKPTSSGNDGNTIRVTGVTLAGAVALLAALF